MYRENKKALFRKYVYRYCTHIVSVCVLPAFGFGGMAAAAAGNNTNTTKTREPGSGMWYPHMKVSPQSPYTGPLEMLYENSIFSNVIRSSRTNITFPKKECDQWLENKNVCISVTLGKKGMSIKR